MLLSQPSLLKKLISFIIPDRKVLEIKRWAWRPSVVCPSVNIFVSAQWLEYCLKYFDDTSQLCRSGHDDMSHIKIRALALLYSYSPYGAFLCIFVCSVNTLWNIIIILHRSWRCVAYKNENSRFHTFGVISPWWFQMQFRVRSLT